MLDEWTSAQRQCKDGILAHVVTYYELFHYTTLLHIDVYGVYLYFGSDICEVDHVASCLFVCPAEGKSDAVVAFSSD